MSLDLIGSTFYKRRTMWLALALCILAHVCDALSSMWSPPWFTELNPFLRNHSGQFVWQHAVVYDAVWISFLSLAGLVFYAGIRFFDEAVAQFSFAFLLITDGMGAFAAAVHNIWLRLGWYVG